MATQVSCRATASGRRATYIYPTMNEILKYGGPIVNGAVPDEAADNTAGAINDLQSALWKWTDENPVRNGAFETD